MSIIDLDADFFSPEDVVHHISTNKPCVVRGFFSPDIVKHYVGEIKNKNLTRYLIGNVVSEYFEKTKMPFNDYLDAYQRDENLLHCNVIRVWRHNKNNLTRWHYDGNGADLLNISLQGKKRFYLAPPNALPVYPFTNIAWKYDFKETHVVEIEPGDMLFLPAYWFHKVLTLEDNTININYIMYNKNNKKIASKRDQELFALHNLFNTSMDKEIKSIYKNEGRFIPAIARGLYELFPFIALFVILYSVAKKTKQRWISFGLLLIAIFIGLYLYSLDSLEIETNGMSRIIGFYILVVAAIFFLVEWNQHQEDFILMG
jgi:hypothetical protein